MSASSTSKSFFLQFQLLLARARFLTFSALLHVALIIIAGSAVLVRHYSEPEDFQAGGELVGSEASLEPPPSEPQPEFQPAIAAPAAAQLPTAALRAITTTTTAPGGFQIASAPVASLDGKLTSMMSGTDGLGDKIAKIGMGGGVRGGTMRFFGMKEKTTGALSGTFYDVKQTRKKRPTNSTVEDYGAVMSEFVREGWRKSVLNDYFQAPQPLYATQIFIPDMSANEGPKAFEMEKEVQPSRWLIHYEGRVSPPRDGVVRFVGAGDDYLVVRFNGKMVLDHGFYKATDWQPDRYYDYGWTAVPKGFARGEKLRVRAGQFYDLEVLIGERPGGKVFFCLMIEEEGADYEKDGKGNPILPVFRLADVPVPELEKAQTLPPHALDGPVWQAAASRAGSGGSSFEESFKTR